MAKRATTAPVTNEPPQIGLAALNKRMNDYEARLRALENSVTAPSPQHNVESIGYHRGGKPNRESV